MKSKRTLSLALLLSASLYASGTHTTQLSPIVVTPAKTAVPLQQVTSDITVVTDEDIRERGFITVDQLLATLPGIQMQRNGGVGQSASVRIRGFDSNRVLVMIDGIRYNDPTLNGGAANFAHLLTDDIARIEIIRGPQSGVWGADASAGVINIITKRALKEGFSATLFGEYGSFDTRKFGFNTAYKKGPFDAALDIVRLASDGFSAIAPDEENLDDYEDDAYKNSTVNLRLGYAITDNDTLHGTFNYIDATTEYDGYDANFMPDPNDTNSSVDTKEQIL
jgi:vitamin B12 transporter